MAKSRAQRKAERRAREKQKAAEEAAGDVSRAQHDTQVPRSGDVEEVEAVEAGIGAGAAEEDLELPDAPAPAKKSRSQKREERKQLKEAEKRQLDDRKRQETEQIAKRRKEASAPRQRGGVIGFLVSCWAELKRVQWPDRDTLIQASAVTLVFVAIAAAYLGSLDALFSEVMKFVL